ncbi:aminotransferase class IV [Streptomyces sp. MBT60]|uniref:aminotransferase class IV n=1 Tax=Streptomyces sp. MBT60 TaxID=2800409 RepID=UPI00190BAAA4|nr:aminotransferase class IV [Streptomyces sp. MBT60]MBK3547907.1 aminotransferase class IV [Streptomyces sp. MBT60]
MTTQPPPPHIELDGRPATEETLRIPALYGFGHFTALQVRDGRVRGLGLHLARLDAANRELFGLPLDGDRVRELIRHALAGAGRRDASVRVNAYLPPGATRTTLMVTVREPAVMPSGARSLMSVPYARTAPHIKRPGEFGQTYYGVLAGPLDVRGGACVRHRHQAPPVRLIDDTVFPVDEELMKDLGAVYDSAPEEAV